MASSASASALGARSMAGSRASSRPAPVRAPRAARSWCSVSCAAAEPGGLQTGGPVAAGPAVAGGAGAALAAGQEGCAASRPRRCLARAQRRSALSSRRSTAGPGVVLAAARAGSRPVRVAEQRSSLELAPLPRRTARCKSLQAGRHSEAKLQAQCAASASLAGSGPFFRARSRFAPAGAGCRGARAARRAPAARSRRAARGHQRVRSLRGRWPHCTRPPRRSTQRSRPPRPRSACLCWPPSLLSTVPGPQARPAPAVPALNG